MTKPAPDAQTVSPDLQRVVQLKNLPTLHEIPKADMDDPLKKLLEKAIAIQLKSINADASISQLAFENLIILVEEMLSNMLMDLHKMANIQRRHCISKKDLLLIIEGYNLSSSDLMLELERSRYVRSRHLEQIKKVEEDSKYVEKQEHTPLTQNELLSSTHPEFFVLDKDVLTLVPPSVKDTKHVPRWLPDFPPDHTYRFTAQYNKPITDERLMKRKLAEEANLSEKALIHLSMLSHEEASSGPIDSDTIYEEAQQETQLLFGPVKKKKTAAINEVNDLLRTLPQQNFSVEEYARNRVEIARRRVNEYERHQLQLQKGAFIKAAHLLSPFSKKRTSCKQVEKEIRTLLHRSRIGLLKSAPSLKERRKREIALAEENRRLRDEKLRKEREARSKSSNEFDVLDLNNLNEDPFFGGLGSSDSEDEQQQEEKATDGVSESEKQQITQDEAALDTVKASPPTEPHVSNTNDQAPEASVADSPKPESNMPALQEGDTKQKDLESATPKPDSTDVQQEAEDTPTDADLPKSEDIGATELSDNQSHSTQISPEPGHQDI